MGTVLLQQISHAVSMLATLQKKVGRFLSFLVIICLKGVLLLVESEDRFEGIAAFWSFEIKYGIEGEDIPVAVCRRQHALIYGNSVIGYSFLEKSRTVEGQGSFLT